MSHGFSAVCDVEEPTPLDVDGTLGVDLGVQNIAADSDGNIYSGKAVLGVRHRRRRLRTKLQTKGTKSAKRKLKQLRGKERRFATVINHQIAKQLVVLAERTKRQIALEDLTHIRSRVRARRQQRATLHSWAFGQLQQFVSYKARLRGIAVHVVDPRNTSRTCPACGQCVKENRKSQAQFLCVSCGFAGHADTIAAGNIARRAAVNPPYASAQSG
ncbi:MAG: transposase [Chloroflexota bacterium]|nr:transposase [Chloroflexota bacterium]